MGCGGQALSSGEQSCVQSTTPVSSSRSDEAKQVKWWSSDVQLKADLSVVKCVSFIRLKYGSEADKVVNRCPVVSSHVCGKQRQFHPVVVTKRGK